MFWYNKPLVVFDLVQHQISFAVSEVCQEMFEPFFEISDNFLTIDQTDAFQILWQR